VIGHRESSTSRRLLQRAERPLLTLGVALFFLVGYFAVGHADHRTVLLDLATPLDGLIPFVPASIWVYLWVFPAALIPLFVVRCPRLFRRTAFAYAIAIAMSLCCFALLPITSQHLRADASTLDPRRASDWAVALVYALDPPYNLLPSLHLSIVTLAALSAWMASRRYGAIAFVGLLLVAVAVCTVKQHFVLDVLGGLALGFLVGAATLGRYRAPPDRSPAYSWRGPMLHGAMVVIILAVLLACHRWLGSSQLGAIPPPGLHGA
jgi:membrane-associated phospholipid phosphatase